MHVKSERNLSFLRMKKDRILTFIGILGITASLMSGCAQSDTTSFVSTTTPVNISTIPSTIQTYAATTTTSTITNLTPSTTLTTTSTITTSPLPISPFYPTIQ